MASPSTGTIYQSSNETVMKILPEGLLQIVRKSKTTLTVSNRGKHGLLDVSVEVTMNRTEPRSRMPARTGP